MSDLEFNGRKQAQHCLFASAQLHNGGLAIRQGMAFSGQYGFVLIGPDISLPGGATHNPPVAMGPIWNQAMPGRAAVTFTSDANYSWVRGHLVNGEWSGPGNTWQNLTPLTPTANHNHATIENYMRAFCQASLSYDTNSPGYQNEWYAVGYLVQCSVRSWAFTPSNTDLYAYAPEFIKVSWRAVSIPKPNLQASAIPAYLATANFVSVPVLPFTPPQRPAAIAGTCLPAAGNAQGQPVYPTPAAFPAAQNNGFDGDIEVHQS
ncbi:hypothetical protein P886_0769 [Alteromonadaceae bacterium 2753L.S.0a.02]|nr:hypothetical protein P886_0769 [Alteromonadaceae bacterium 2753L.S.0a.02]